MKAIPFLTLCLCLTTFLPHQTDAFGCSPEFCSIVTFFRPFCCVFYEKCCEKAFEDLKVSKPLAECNSNAAAAAVVANPSNSRLFANQIPWRFY
ncbi:unnamed protein product [Larinioides sclopetarius]